MRKTEHEKEIIEDISNKSASPVKNTNILGAAFMVFILPIISVFIGVLIGGFVGQSIGASVKIFQVIGGLSAFVLAVVLIKLYDKSAKLDENAEKITWEDM